MMKKRISKVVNNVESGEESRELRLYTVNIYYGGFFVHIPIFSYSDNQTKVIEGVDLEHMSVRELRICVGDILGEFDSLYYKKLEGIVLFTDDKKEEVIKFSRACGNVCTLFVHHVTSDEDLYEGGYFSCSDEEFVEIRRSSRVEKERIEQYEEYANNEEYNDDEYESEGSEMNAYTSEASTATHPQAFKSAMKELERASKGAYEKMNQLDLGVWSKAYFKTHSKADSTENNMSACFNSWILKARYMPVIEMLTEIHDMIMTRLHQKRDWMKQRNCVVVPRIKKIIDDAIKESAGYTVLWDGNENYVVKGNGSSVCVSLKHRICSCRLWELTGVPCTHAITAIQESRQNPLDFVEKWYTKECYLQTYSHSLEVIKGEEYWEHVMGDLVLPPMIVKKLRGRPKNQRRREGWEGSVSNGKRSRMNYKGRIMHCGYCRKEGHKRTACPDKEIYEQEAARKAAQPKKKGGKKQQHHEVMEEVFDEVRLQQEEKDTGETNLMDEVMAEMEKIVRSEDIPLEQTTMPKSAHHNAMKFMPTPSLRQYTGSGCTPPASTPPEPAKKRTPRKSVSKFAAPRKK